MQVVILAAGKGTRFSGERGKGKLTAKIDQKPMYMHMMDKCRLFHPLTCLLLQGMRRL